MTSTKGFVLSLERFQERAALLSLLTPQGIIFVYDGHFFQRYERLICSLKETYFQCTLAQGGDHNRFYLIKLVVLKVSFFEGERLILWQLAQTFMALTQSHSEREDLIFQSYFFLYTKLSLEEKIDFEKIYFYLSYIIFHSLAFMGEGPFIYHYQCAMEHSVDDRDLFHSNFSSQKVQSQHFDKILQYLCQHWYTCFSSHIGLEICYQCWMQTKSLATQTCESAAILSKFNA